MGETANGAVLAAGAETQDAESLGNDNALLLVVGRGDTLEDLKALHSGGTTGGLVGNHAADSLVEDAGRSTEVEGTTASGVETSHLAEVGVVLHCRSKFESAFCPKPVPAWLTQVHVLSCIPFSYSRVSFLFATHYVPWAGLGLNGYHSDKRWRFERTLRAEELAGDVEGLTSHNDDLLTVKQLLGNSAGQATKEVSLAVDDDLLKTFKSAIY